MSAKVISLSDFRKRKNEQISKEQLFYMDKFKLLDQLVRYYDEIKTNPFDIELALWGEDLMDVISTRCLSRELHDMMDEYEAGSKLKVEPSDD
ncbi:hypothetical protein ACFLRA_03450 [Bdellovibrionota bacterium]